MTRAARAATTLFAALALLLAGCTDLGGAGEVDPADPNTLRVLAGSELADMQPVLDRARQETGVTVVLHEEGTLEASSQVASGRAAEDFDALWISSNRYLSMIEGGEQQVVANTRTMTSPVLVGVRPQQAQRLGWSTQSPPTWAQISQASAEGRFDYAMTNPSASNSGFSTLVAVASALSGGGPALDEARTQQVMPQLAEFFNGQELTAGSTGWLTDAFVADPGVDGLFSYESTLLALNGSGRLPEPLVLIAPADGVVSGDYPLSFLASADPAKRQAYDTLTAWLRTPQAQEQIMRTTWRRPMTAGVGLDPAFGPTTQVELPFPATHQVAENLITGYFDTARRPPVTVYVLDVSGSMRGERIEAMKEAMTGLATRTGGDFTTFHAREDITVLPFSAEVGPAGQFVVDPEDPDRALAQVRRRVDTLQADGNTRLFEAMAEAYRIIDTKIATNPDSYATVVVLTDGEATGAPVSFFDARYRRLSPAAQQVPAFAILFGDSSSAELDHIARTTGGRVFDGREDLSAAFRTIRGYQ